MRRLIYSAVAVACAGATFALSPIFVKDWPANTPGNNVWIDNLNHDLDLVGKMELNGVTYNGPANAGMYVGIYNYQISHSGPVNANTARQNFLCVELDQARNQTGYETLRVKGYAGYLANQINVIAGMSAGVNQINNSVALALATWELAYDSTEYGYLGAAGVASLDGGKLKLLSLNGVDSTRLLTIKTLAANYVNSAIRYGKSDYNYYHNPRGGMDDGGHYSQDLIGSVPGPAAVLPFLLGFGASLRRRRK